VFFVKVIVIIILRGKTPLNWKQYASPKILDGSKCQILNDMDARYVLDDLDSNRRTPNDAWAGSKLPYDDADMTLFRASTKIVIGEGETASFWHDN
jgi:hypothetical protein